MSVQIKIENRAGFTYIWTYTSDSLILYSSGFVFLCLFVCLVDWFLCFVVVIFCFNLFCVCACVCVCFVLFEFCLFVCFFELAYLEV